MRRTKFNRFRAFAMVPLLVLICSCNDNPVSPPSCDDGPPWEAWSDPHVFTYALGTMWGTSDADLYAVGSNEMILHFDGQAWSVLHHGAGSMLDDIWCDAGGALFAVGSDGTVLNHDGALWRRMAVPTAADLHGVWGRAATDVYAVGSGGTVLHYDGQQWMKVDSGTDRDLRDVWGDADYLYAVGDGGTLLELGPASAHAVDIGTSNDLHGAGGSSSVGFYALGSTGTVVYRETNAWHGVKSGTVRDFWKICVTATGGVFAIQEGYSDNVLFSAGPDQGAMTFEVIEVLNTPRGVWADAPDNIFATTWDEIAHYDGTTTTMDLPPPDEGEDDLEDVWGTSASDFYAVDYRSIRHYDGSTWTEFSSDVRGFVDVWGTSSTDLYAISVIALGTPPPPPTLRIRPGPSEGPEQTTSKIHRGDGTTWSVSAVLDDVSLADIWGTPSGDLFAVGSWTEWVADEPIGWFRHHPLILRSEGDGWTEVYRSEAEGTLNAVWGRSETDVFVVGSEGRILHRDDTGWTESTSGTVSDLMAVWGYGDAFVMAAGGDGTLLRFAGGQWTPMPGGERETILGIWGSSGHDVYAVGLHGDILHYDGVRWRRMTSPTFNDLNGIWGAGAGDVFAVGGQGTILHRGQ